MNTLKLAFGLLLVACAAAAQPVRDRLTIGMAEFPGDMHPFITNQLVRSYVHAFVRRTVVAFDGDSRLICQLCTELPSVANGRVQITRSADGVPGMKIRFTLRPGLKWGDGTPMTSRDVKFGFEVQNQFQPETGLVGVETVDDSSYDVVFTVTRYDFDRLSPDALPAHLEEPIWRAAKDPLEYGRQSLYNRAPTTPGLWSGPYLVSAYTPGSEVQYKPNPHWDGGKPYFQTITAKQIENTAALYANLLSGDIDLASGLTLDQGVALQKDYGDKFEVIFKPSLNLSVLVPNMENPQLADIRVRQAILLGIDRETMIKKLFENKYIAADGVLSPAEQFRNPNITHYGYDPAKARTLLAEAGFKPGPDKILVGADGKKLSIDLVGASGIRLVELVEQVLQSQLKAIGIEIVLRNEPPRVLLGETVRKRTFTGLLTFTWVPGPDSLPYGRFHSTRIPSDANSRSGNNYGGYSNPKMDTLLAAAQSNLDPEKRRVEWNEIQALIANDLPIIPLYHPASIFVQPSWLIGILPPKSLTLPSRSVEDWRPR